MSKKDRHGFRAAPDFGDDVAAVVASAPPEPLKPPEPEVTIDRLFGGKMTAVQAAFARGEKRVYGTRKFTKAQWAALFQQFLDQPR